MRLLLLPLLFAATSIGPGYAVVRSLRFSALERFVASIGASLVLIYLATFGIFVANVDVRWNYATTAVATGITLIFARELLNLISHRRVRHAICGCLIVCAFALLLDMTMRHFSGADWSYDWLEHFQRSEFFLHKLPADFQFAIYSLPARPPMMNVICAYFMAHTGVRFEAYQVIFTILNSLVFLACCLFLPRFTRGRVTMLLAAAFVVSPVFTEHATFAWTKLFTGFFCLMGLHFYLRSRYAAAFTALAAGMLVHYSAGPWAVVIGVHYVYRLLRTRRVCVRELAACAIVPGLLLLTWVGWSAKTYGVHETFASNTAVTDASTQTRAENLEKLWINFYRTALPHPAYVPYEKFAALYHQPSALGFWRDYFFLIFETNYFFSIGSVGGLIVAWLLWRRLRPAASRFACTEQRQSASAGFWRWFIPSLAFLGVAVHGATADWGVAHICLAPLSLLGTIFLVASLRRLPRIVRGIAIAGFIVDAGFVLVQFICEARTFNIVRVDEVHDRIYIDANSLNSEAIRQYHIQLTQQLTLLGDHFGMLAAQLLTVVAILLFTAVAYIAIQLFRTGQEAGGAFE